MSTNRSASNSTATSATTFVAENVVADGLERVRLHHRHVLVRRGVEDDARAVAIEDLAHLLAVADVGDHGHARREVALVRQLALDLEERRLGLVDEDQPRRARPVPT